MHYKALFEYSTVNTLIWQYRSMNDKVMGNRSPTNGTMLEDHHQNENEKKFVQVNRFTKCQIGKSRKSGTGRRYLKKVITTFVSVSHMRYPLAQIQYFWHGWALTRRQKRNAITILSQRSSHLLRKVTQRARHCIQTPITIRARSDRPRQNRCTKHLLYI